MKSREYVLALEAVRKALGPEGRKQCSIELTKLEQLVGGVDARGAWWNDKDKRARAIDTMRQAGAERRAAANRANIRITSRSTGASRCVTVAEAAKILRLKPSTVRVYLASKRGVFSRFDNDDILDVARLG